MKRLLVVYITMFVAVIPLFAHLQGRVLNDQGGRRKDPKPYAIDLTTGRIDGFMKHGILLNEESNMSLGI